MVGRCFVLGNLWLMFALLMLLGRRVVRTEPYMVSFFGGDHAAMLYPGTYSVLVALAIGAGVLCLYLSWKAASARTARPSKGDPGDAWKDRHKNIYS
jgi:hypothetical protein